MDEEDGRPGPRARQFGPFDAPMDVPGWSLCRSRLIPEQVAPFTRMGIVNIRSRRSFTEIQTASIPCLVSVAGLPKASARTQVEENLNENVPGK